MSEPVKPVKVVPGAKPEPKPVKPVKVVPPVKEPVKVK